jgi:hypothetical protein
MVIKEFAVCFSGQPRQIHKGHSDFVKLMEGLEYDVFAHLWECKSLLSGWGNNMGWENRQTQIFHPDEFFELYKPALCAKEVYEDTEFYKHTSANSGYGNPVNKFFSSYSQFYSLRQAIQIKEKFESENNLKYKYVLRYRTDAEVEFANSNIDWDSIKKRLDENPNVILVNPGWDWPDGHGCSNNFAIGTSEGMRKYSLLFDNYPSIVRTNPYASYDESNLKMHLEQLNGLKVEHCGIHQGIYR